MIDECVPAARPRLRRRELLASLAGAALAWPQARAESPAAPWPPKMFHLISPWAPGSGTDIVARLVADKLSAELGVAAVVEARPGAAGNIGSAYAAHQPADGSTLLVTSASFAIAPALYHHLAFDPVKDFVPVTKIATAPLLVLVRADSPLRTMADLVAFAKKNPQGVTYGSFGIGSPSHLIGESINRLAGITMTHVPYASGGGLTDLLGGRLTIAILDALSQTPQVKSGRLRALALNGTQRLPALPDVPTLVESGIPFDTVGWQAVFVPAGTPHETVERLGQGLNAILAEPDVRQRIHEAGLFPVVPATTSADWGTMFRADVRTWAEMVRRSGATID